jgi:hypothetical protein
MSETPRTAEQLAIELSNRAFDCGGNDSSASQSRIARREAALNKAEKDVIERITTLERELAAMTARVQLAERRLAEEIKWGHRCCTPDNCVSSGTDCPARKQAVKERG